MLTVSEENYLKTIFKIAEKETKSVSTNSIAKMMGTSPASVTDMLHKLFAHDLIYYEKYKGVTLTHAGKKAAIHLIRKHRLWEVFLVQKLRFSWHQVQDIAEKLKHIESNELISRLDAYLDYPKFDPYGDPIPTSEGKFTIRSQKTISELLLHQSGIVIGLKEHPDDFLKYLMSINIKLGTHVTVAEIINYEKSIKIIVDQKQEVLISQNTSHMILLKPA